MEYLTYGGGASALITTRPNQFREYKIVDHLGSTRVVVDSNGAVLNTTDYEPFGKPLTGLPPREGFIGKEQDKESELADHGVRKFNYNDGIFTSIDPLWEKYPSVSPYNYCGNNPLGLIDPIGTEWFDINGNGDWVYKKNTKSMPVLRKDKEGNDVTVEQAGIKQLLTYNGKELAWLKGDGSRESWKAVSGDLTDGKTDPNKQWLKSGPLPEGDYYVDPTSTQYREDITKWDAFLGSFGRGTWPGGNRSWGDIRTPIYPQTDFRGERTGGYSIHGGVVPGSRGCIDLTNLCNSFFTSFTSQRQIVPLYVKY